MIAIENRGSSLTKAIAITSQTIHVTCTPRLAATGVVTGVSVTYSGAAAVLMVFAALWNFVMSCVTKRHFKRNDGDKLSERELATKMLMNRSTMRGSGAGRGDDMDVYWNDKFFTAVGQKAASGRKNSMFVNDTYVNMFG